MSRAPFDLTWQRCFNHAQREAVGRCLDCGRFFCRECIIDHDGRLICAGCLRRTPARPPLGKSLFEGVARGFQSLVGLGLAWFFFYLLGELLLRLPHTFHEGTLWK